MGSSVALLTLLAPVLVTAALDLTELVERFPLKGAIQVTAVRAQPIAGRIVIESSNGPALAAELRSPTRTLCTEVSQEYGAVVLRCPSRYIAASMVRHAGGQSLEVRVLRVAPWAGRDGLPVIPFDPYRLGLGDGCPGDTPAGRGECAIAAGNFKEAREQFQGATEGVGAALATLRLGDLAALDDDLPEAVRMWQQVPAGSPFRRLASARLCETEPTCLSSTRTSILYSLAKIDAPLHADLVLRRARVDAFAGRSLEAAQSLSGEHAPGGACVAEPTLCGDILLDALRQPAARGTQALAIYLATPSRDRGPVAIDLARAASDRCATSGAPVFAANLLSAVTGGVDAIQLPDHLARTAELYLEGNDPVRASVVLEFARSRLTPAQLATPRWAKIVKGAASRPAAPAPVARPPADLKNLEADLGAAKRTVAGSRELAPEGAQ